MASHDKKILKPWIGKSWEAFRGATTPGGAVSPGDVDEFDIVPRVYSETPEEKEFYGNEIPPEVAELKKAAEGPSGLGGGTTGTPSELSKSPVPAETAPGGTVVEPEQRRPGEGKSATPADTSLGPRPYTAAERAGWDKTLGSFRGRVKEEMAKEKPVFSDETFGADIRALETVPKDYLRMDMATGGGKPGYGVAMSSTGHMTVGTPSGRTISTRPGAAIEDAQQEILGRINYLQNTPVEKQYQDYLSENKRQYPKGPITTKLNEWGTTSTEGEPLDFKTFKKDLPARIEGGFGSLERLSGAGKEAPSAVPRPFEFSTDYQTLYGKVRGWLQDPDRHKKELAVAVPLLDKMAGHEINAYKESGATGSFWKGGISPADSAKIAKDVSAVSAVPSEIELRKAQAGELTKKTEAIPSDIEYKKAQTEAIRDKVASNPYFQHVMTASMEEVMDDFQNKTKRFNPDIYNQLAPNFGLPTLPKSEGGQVKKPTLDEFIKEARKRNSKLTGEQLKAYYGKEYGGI